MLNAVVGESEGAVSVDDAAANSCEVNWWLDIGIQLLLLLLLYVACPSFRPEIEESNMSS